MPLNRFHNSGRWFLGSHWLKSSRWEKKRSLAQAFSSSRRAPPIRIELMFFDGVDERRGLEAIAARVCSRFLLGLLESIVAWTLPTMRRAPRRSTRLSRNSIVSGKLCPVSMCTSGIGMRLEQALAARWVTTMLSLRPENGWRTVELGRDFAQHVDGLGFEFRQMINL